MTYTPDEVARINHGQTPIPLPGRTVWLSSHARDRCQGMGVNPDLIPVIIRSGTCKYPPPGSKYLGYTSYSLGDVTVVISQDSTIPTILWSTADAWYRHGTKGDRALWDKDKLQHAIQQWTTI